MAHTPRQSGADQPASHSLLYQGVLAVQCQECSTEHKLMITSDERHVVEGLMTSLITSLRRVGFNPFGALTASYHPGTDLQFRDWHDTVSDLLNSRAMDDIPF